MPMRVALSYGIFFSGLQCKVDLLDGPMDIPLDGWREMDDGFVELEGDRETAEELVGDHCHFVLREPLRIFGRERLV